MRKLKLLMAACALMGSAVTTWAQTDVTSQKLNNPSFELSAAGTPLTSVQKASNATALSMYGWTQNLNEITDFNNTEIVDNTTQGSNSNHSSAVSAAHGNYHLFFRRSWNANNTANISFTSNSASYEPGEYTITYSYILEEGTSQGHTTTGSYLTINVLEGSTVIGTNRVNAKNWGTTTPYTNTWATSTLTFSITGTKTLSLSAILTPRGGNKTELHLDNFNITFSPFATAEDYANLNSAISTVEGKPWGFDEGEYAPYNYAGILEALATAKAIDQSANNSQVTVQALTTTLNGADWSSTNTAEVNAIYDGNFDDAKDNVATHTIPKGWHGSDSHYSEGYWTRYMYSNGSSDAGLLHFSNGSAMMSKTTPRYGLDAGYTMPLKADTYYKLSFDYAGWNSELVTTVIITDGSDATVTITPSATETSANAGQTNKDDWKSYSGVFKTNSAGNYKIKFDKREYNGDGGQVTYGAISLVRATVSASEIKPLLLAEITAANAIYNSGANVGTGIFQIPEDAGTTFSYAITTAQNVYDNASATVDEFSTAIANLQEAKTTYANATLNAPNNEKRYWVTIVEDGKDWNGNAITFIAGGRGDEGNYAIKYLTTSNENFCQAIKFTATTGNKYKLSVVRADNGYEQYLTTNKSGGYGSNTAQIRTTDDAAKALEVEIKATTANGQFQLYNTDANAIIANNNNNDMYTANSCNFTIAEASQATVNVTIDKDVKYGTRIFPFAPSLPSGVKAYSCEAASGSTLTLVEVATPQANTPYILEATSGCASTDLEGWGTASADNYTAGWLTGVYASRDAINGTYVLQNNGGKVGFYQVDTEKATPTVGAYRCYMTVPTTARPAFFFGDETTAIDAINALTSGSATIYSVDGRHLPSLQKGLNIVKTNGKTYKVMVK